MSVSKTNRQEEQSVELKADATEYELLIPTLDNSYQEGMAVNGGESLHVELDLTGCSSDVRVRGYKRLTTTSAWIPFYDNVFPDGAIYPLDRDDIKGYFAVRLTAERSPGDDEIVVVAATIV